MRLKGRGGREEREKERETAPSRRKIKTYKEIS
jgi:hypothetical protein